MRRAGAVLFQGFAGAAIMAGGTSGTNSIEGGTGALFAVGLCSNATVIANSSQTNYLGAGQAMKP
ncbi:MAG: hypothetical protein B7Z58_00065 [Acidiphilium sp. 37-64-53]|nr:MAG: hypothetical protein B7Z58_00065 [Acidiphilium sp. 37-64-53]